MDSTNYRGNHLNLNKLRPKEELKEESRSILLGCLTISPRINSPKDQEDHQVWRESVIVYFQEIEQHLLKHIQSADYIIGCVAWLTNENILSALSQKKGVKIIVNKEDFLSSQTSSYTNKQLIQNWYPKIPSFNFSESCLGTAILTFGIANHPSRLHHKFLIFYNSELQPQGVWTGSYNFTRNSNFSLENAIYLEDSNIIQQYIQEFHFILQHSESYDWKCNMLVIPDT